MTADARGPGWDAAAEADLDARLGVRVADRGLLEQALTHRSYCAEHPEASSNERLEHLGDAVLGLAVTDHVYGEFPDLPEGRLSAARASVVNAEVLAGVADELGVGRFLRLGKGEDASGGRTKASILADAVEAVIGAVYLDAGWPVARELVIRLFAARMAAAAAEPGVDDHKSRLQEWAARRSQPPPRYHLHQEGPDHSPSFHATVLVGGQVLGTGEGRTKRQAEQGAARAAWRRVAADGETVEHEADLAEAGVVHEPARDADGPAGRA